MQSDSGKYGGFSHSNPVAKASKRTIVGARRTSERGLAVHCPSLECTARLNPSDKIAVIVVVRVQGSRKPIASGWTGIGGFGLSFALVSAGSSSAPECNDGMISSVRQAFCSADFLWPGHIAGSVSFFCGVVIYL